MGARIQSPIIRSGNLLAAIIFLISAPVSGFFLTRIFLEARSTAHWPSVSGILTKADITQSAGDQYNAIVEYTYHVGTADFTGTRIKPSDGQLPTRDAAERYLSNMHADDTVTVFYNPTDPSQSVLRAGADFQEYALLLIPLVMLAIALYLLRRVFIGNPTSLQP